MVKITFTNTTENNSITEPKPASRVIPDWYKKTSSYIDEKKAPDGNGNGKANATIKKCIPVFDAITSGYIIELPMDVYVSQQDGKPLYEWSSFEMVGIHPVSQAELHPANNGFPYPKWINPWSIKTPPGYSCLIVQPFHRESVFTILPGVVDTDKYTSPINFPFTLNDPNFEGLIPMGTPIAQVIPFKRDRWEMNIGDGKDLNHAKNAYLKLQNKFFDGYKQFFWNRKEYK